MEKRRHDRHSEKIPLGSVGLAFCAGMLVAGLVVFVSEAPAAEFFLMWMGLLFLSILLFGIVIPGMFGIVFAILSFELVGPDLRWLPRTLLALHWIAYVPLIAFLVVPATIDMPACPEMQSPGVRVASSLAFGAAAALPLQLFIQTYWPLRNSYGRARLAGVRRSNREFGALRGIGLSGFSQILSPPPVRRPIPRTRVRRRFTLE
jgi:hypothetical protein